LYDGGENTDWRALTSFGDLSAVPILDPFVLSRLSRRPIPFMRGFEAWTVDARSKAALRGTEILESRR
jgi:hypothetical protein